MSAADAILVVDDDRGVRQTLRAFLEREGYAVDVARTGAEGLQKIREGTFGLVLLDLVLPDIKGTAVMREAQPPPLAPPPEFIIVTGHATLDSAIEALEGSAAGYMPKPLDFARLGRIVRRVFERRRLQRENAELQAVLAGRLAESEALVEIASTISSTLDTREALRRVCRALARLLGADTVAAYLHDPATDQLVPAAGYHVPKEHLATLAGVPLPLRDQGFYLPMWQERRPVWSDDVARDARFTHEMFRTVPHQSGLILPLLLDAQVAGGFYALWWTAHRSFADAELRTLEQVCTQAGFLLRNAQLFEQGERNRHRIEALHDVSRQLAAVHDTEEVLNLIVNQAARLVSAEAAGLRLLEGDDLVVGARTESAAPLMTRPRIKPGESLSGKVVATGATVVVEDLAQDTTYDPAHKRGALERGFRGFIGAPLKSRGRVLGTLNVYTKGARHFLPDEMALLEALADQASTAIEKARLFRETRAREEEATKLYGVTRELASSLDRARVLDLIVAQTVALTGCEASGIYVHDPARGGLVLGRGLNLEPELIGALVLAPGEGIGGRAFLERRPVWTRDWSADSSLQYAPAARALIETKAPRAFLGVPIVSRDEVHGVLMEYYFAPHEFGEREIRLVSTLADHAALAFENVRLLEETRRREEEAQTLSRVLALLNQATRALQRTLEVDRMLGGALDELARAFGADAALVNLLAADGTVLRSVGHWLSEAQRRELHARRSGITAHVRDTRQALWIHDIAERREMVHPENFTRGVRSIAALPIVGQQGRALGVLVLYYKTPQRFPETEVRLLASYADQLATALENAQVYEEAQTQRVRLAQIFDSTSDGILLAGRGGDIQALNARAGELLGFDAGRAVGTPLAAVLAALGRSTPEAEGGLAALRALLDDPERGGAGDLDLRRHGRVIHWVGQPTRDAAGAAIGLTLTLQDVTHERQVAQLKSDFVSFVTHQLRTPLAGIKWMLELAAQTREIPAEPASYIRDATDSADRLIGLVNDLLDASRLESGALKLRPAPTSLAEVTRSVLEELETLVRAKGHRVALVGVETAPRVLADAQLLRQVILNLASNAIKYTPAGGTVTVRLAREDGAARWAITDTGVGIPKPSQARLFEKFFRAENASTVETEGTGLGLYLVRLIVERLGGRVWCESEEGRGATFAFTLPLGE